MAVSNGIIPTDTKTLNADQWYGALAPRKAVLQTTYICSVPIGISKSYSQDSIGNTFNQEDGYSINEEEDHEKNVSYASKYTGPTTNAMKQVDSFDESSPGSVKRRKRFLLCERRKRFLLCERRKPFLL